MRAEPSDSYKAVRAFGKVAAVTVADSTPEPSTTPI